MGAIIEARGLGKRYRSGRQDFWVFRNLDFQLEPGDMVCVWGPSLPERDPAGHAGAAERVSPPASTLAASR